MKTRLDIIKEPPGVDFEVDPKPLSSDEEAAISAFIRKHKAETAKSRTSSHARNRKAS